MMTDGSENGREEALASPADAANATGKKAKFVRKKARKRAHSPPSIISIRIKSERERQHITQEEMGNVIEKSAEFFAKIESGARYISAEDLVLVANFLGRPVEFFTGEKEESEIEKELENIMESTTLQLKYKAELHGIPKLRTKEAIVELTECLKPRQFGILRQEIYEIITEVLRNGDSQRLCHRKIKVLDHKMPELIVRYICHYGLEKRFCGGFDVKLLKERCNCGRSEVEVGYVRCTEDVSFFSIFFHPPLRRGDIADIWYEESCESVFAMSQEDVELCIHERKLLGDMPEVGAGIDVFAPTDFVRSRISFPRNYELNHVGSVALISRMRLFDECERLNREGCLSQIRVGSREVLELSVKQPVVGAQYFITWQPPSKEDYMKLLPDELAKKRKSQMHRAKDSVNTEEHKNSFVVNGFRRAAAFLGDL